MPTTFQCVPFCTVPQMPPPPSPPLSPSLPLFLSLPPSLPPSLSVCLSLARASASRVREAYYKEQAVYCMPSERERESSVHLTTLVLSKVPVDVRVLGACVWIDVRVLAVLDLRNAKKSIRRTLPECSRLVQDGVFTPIIVVCLMFKKNTSWPSRSALTLFTASARVHLQYHRI